MWKLDLCLLLSSTTCVRRNSRLCVGWGGRLILSWLFVRVCVLIIWLSHIGHAALGHVHHILQHWVELWRATSLTAWSRSAPSLSFPSLRRKLLSHLHKSTQVGHLTRRTTCSRWLLATLSICHHLLHKWSNIWHTSWRLVPTRSPRACTWHSHISRHIRRNPWPWSASRCRLLTPVSSTSLNSARVQILCWRLLN